MMNYLLITGIFFSLNCFGQVQCPDPAIAADYISPVTRNRRVTCGYMKDGVLIKHGPDIEYDAPGKIIKEAYFTNNKESEKPKVEIPVSETFTEEFKVVEQLLKVLAYEKVNDGEFRIHKCDSNPKTWVKAAVTSTAVNKTYLFNEQCDVSGSFVASFTEDFDVKFDLRNLRGFNRTEMKVKMKLNQKASGIRYSFDVINGTVSSEKQSITFTAHYETNIDPLTGSTMYSTQEGNVTLTKVGNKNLNITRPLIFSR